MKPFPPPFDDPILNGDNMMFSMDKHFDPAKPTILLFLSCHGRTMIHYYSYARPDLTEKYNIIRLETGPMTIHFQNGLDVYGNPAVRMVFGMADIVVTYNMGARMRHHQLSKVEKLFKPGARVITIVAPNFGCFCPMSYDGFGSHLGLLKLFDAGKNREEVFNIFKAGDFDPMFDIRWRLDLGRIIDKESHHDIGLSQFIKRNYRKIKLWMGPSHPTYIVMAHYGNEVGGLLGHPKHTEEQILEMDYSMAAVGGQPETQYEFSYFKFDYPMRHRDEGDYDSYYGKVIDAVYEYWHHDGAIMPQVD
jgi:hypothetical protein